MNGFLFVLKYILLPVKRLVVLLTPVGQPTTK